MNDWEFLKDVTLWQLAVVIVAIYVMVKLIVGLWPGLRNTIKLIDSVGDLPKFMESTEKKLEEVHHEVHYNNGTSIKDAVKRVENGVAGVYPELVGLHEKVDAHIDHSIRWKSRLEQIDERTQPTRPIIERKNNE